MRTEHTDIQAHVTIPENKATSITLGSILGILIGILIGVPIAIFLAIMTSSSSQMPGYAPIQPQAQYQSQPQYYDDQQKAFKRLPGVQRNPDLIPAKPRKNYREEEYRSEYRYH